MSLPRYEILLLIFLVAVMIMGQLFHKAYFSRIERHVKGTSDPDRTFLRNDLKKALRIPKGANFNTVMIFAWLLLLVAFIFLYFLTPTIFPELNYFRFSKVASESFGLAIFGVAVILIPGLFVTIHIPRAYSYYLIHIRLKEMNLMTPLLLIGSILCSVHLGTIYPGYDQLYWVLGYVTLLISLVLLLSPIIIGLAEEMRT